VLVPPLRTAGLPLVDRRLKGDRLNTPTPPDNPQDPAAPTRPEHYPDAAPDAPPAELPTEPLPSVGPPAIALAIEARVNAETTPPLQPQAPGEPRAAAGLSLASVHPSAHDLRDVDPAIAPSRGPLSGKDLAPPFETAEPVESNPLLLPDEEDPVELMARLYFGADPLGLALSSLGPWP